ncbi:MAG TPA: sugar nucleotide-binding protein, partial [Verrucomicrobiae bacterium]|nr:sugar nucleotide-binding protein [Verrucomicrobiae bacterium]
LHVSTDYVFDGAAGRAYTEQDAPNPQSVYGESKLAGEKAVAAANPRHMIVRTAWLYSETGNNFPKTMIKLAAQGEVRVVEDQFGSPTYALDLARGIEKLISTQAYGIYHLAGSGKASWYSFAAAIFRAMGIPAKVTPIPASAFPRPARRPAYSVLETRRGVVLPPWEKGLETFAANMKQRERAS